MQNYSSRESLPQFNGNSALATSSGKGSLTISSYIILFLSVIFYSCNKNEPVEDQRKDTEVRKPIINLLVPNTGFNNDTIEVFGKNFKSDLGNISLKFGNEIVEIVSLSDTSLSFIVPAGDGSVDVSVEVGSEISNSVPFTYRKVVIEPFPPQTMLRLGPGTGNPRNSEGDFINLKDGRVLFVYTRYYGTSAGDHATAYLAGRYSNDGGMTWTTNDEIIVENEGGMNVMSVTLLRLQNGDIALFYLRKNSVVDCIPMMRVSKDEGATWSDAQPCTSETEGYFVLNNDRVIQLEDGRLLMAVSRHQVPGGAWKNQGDLFSYYSDDNGLTWHLGARVPNSSTIITQEPGLIEMNDGRVMMYIRASGGYQQLSYSSDRGESWSHIESSNIPSPLSPATIKPIPETGDWLLVWNNNDGSNPLISGKRTPLTVAVSRDEGKTWEKIKDIIADPDGWYCYIAVHFIDQDNVLLGYCAGSQSARTHLSVTDITLLNKQWLYKSK